jgi:hypothetical protein
VLQPLFRLEDLRRTNLATHEQAKQKASAKTPHQKDRTTHTIMGKAGRFACILTPMILTVASLITVALLLAGGTKRSILPSFYYVRVSYSITLIPSAIPVEQSLTYTPLTARHAQPQRYRDNTTQHHGQGPRIRRFLRFLPLELLFRIHRR